MTLSKSSRDFWKNDLVQIITHESYDKTGVTIHFFSHSTVVSGLISETYFLNYEKMLKKSIGYQDLRKNVGRILLIGFRRNLNFCSASFLSYILIFHLLIVAFFKIFFHAKYSLMRRVIFSLISNCRETETFIILTHMMSMYSFATLLKSHFGIGVLL